MRPVCHAPSLNTRRNIDSKTQLIHGPAPRMIAFTGRLSALPETVLAAGLCRRIGRRVAARAARAAAAAGGDGGIGRVGGVESDIHVQATSRGQVLDCRLITEGKQVLNDLRVGFGHFQLTKVIFTAGGRLGVMQGAFVQLAQGQALDRVGDRRVLELVPEVAFRMKLTERGRSRHTNGRRRRLGFSFRCTADMDGRSKAKAGRRDRALHRALQKTATIIDELLSGVFSFWRRVGRFDVVHWSFSCLDADKLSGYEAPTDGFLSHGL